MEGSQGVGQQDPSDSTSEFNEHDFHIQQSIVRLSTVKLVKVIAVSAATVDVQPLVNLIDGDGNKTQEGTIYGLQWGATQWGDNAIVAQPAVGDLGLIACADRDTSAAIAAKGVANPGSKRIMDRADGIYLGGLPGLNDAPKQSIKMDSTGITWSDRSGNIFNSDSEGFHFNKPVTFAETATVEGNLQLGGSLVNDTGGLYAGNVHVGGTITGDTDVVAAGISGKGHHHGGVVVGSGNTGVPV